MSLVLDSVVLSALGRPLFAPVSVRVAAAEVVTVMGPSGCGKSSLLAHVSGTLPPGLSASGRVLLEGRDLDGLPAEARRVGVVFQDPLLFPHLSVGENLAFGLARSVRGAARRAQVAEALEAAGLSGMAARDPATLSGGQRARVALLRTLLAAPRAVLLDEPFASLDAPLRRQMRGFVLDHLAAAGVPAILVTHDAAEAAGRVITLDPPVV